MPGNIEMAPVSAVSEVVHEAPQINDTPVEEGIMGFLKQKELEESKTSKPAEEEEVEETNTEEPTEDSGEEESSSREVKFQVGDQEFSVPEGYELDLKVDGKSEKVSIAELKKNYSGKVAYDKKFQELHVLKTEFADNVKTIDRKLNDVFVTMKKDPEAGLKKLYKMAKLEEQYDVDITKIRADLQEDSTLSDEQREIKKEKRRLVAEREELEADKNKRNVEEQRSTVEKYADTLMSKHNVSVEEFAVASGAILKNTSKEKLDAMTAETLVEESIKTVLVERDSQFMDNVIKKVDAAKHGDRQLKRDVLEVMSAAKMDFTEENIDYVTRELLGKKKPVTSKENSNHAATKATPGAPSKSNVANAGDGDDDEILALARGFLAH